MSRRMTANLGRPALKPDVGRRTGRVMSASSPAFAKKATSLRAAKFSIVAIAWTALSATLGACGDPNCPAGTVADGKFCRRTANNSAGDGLGSQTNTVGSSGTAAPPTAGSSATTEGAAGAVAPTSSGSAGVSPPNMSIAGVGMHPALGVAGVGAAGATASAGAAAIMSLPGGASGAAGVATGAAGNGTACSPQPESCDNQDNDCDGKIDETVTRPCGNGTPPCKQGTQSCMAGAWATDCAGEVKGNKEVCDGADNDCNGVIDEGCTCTDGQTRQCGNATSPCKQGTQTCTNGVWPTECPGEIKGSAEVCDGVDNDCNGTKDDGGDALCSGNQHCLGTQKCVQCTGDSDCQGTPPSPCKVNYCDLSRHACAQKNADPRTSCNGSWLCSAGNCVECLGPGDCGSGKTCTANTCQKSAMCGDNVTDVGEECDNGSANSDNSDCTSHCKLNVCGDRHWNSTGRNKEDCDVGDRSSFADGRPWDDWSCASCRRRYVYTPCSQVNGPSDECGGSYCDNSNGGVCLPSCSVGSGTDPYACVPYPGRTGTCVAGGCAMRCDDNPTCPPRIACAQSATDTTKRYCM
jgi:hypothetical protein